MTRVPGAPGGVSGGVIATVRTMTPADQLRELLRDGGRVNMPGVFDALSARCAEDAGFPVLFVTGFGVSAARLAAPDIGYVTQTEMAGSAREVCRATQALVLVDADTGYGDALSAVRTAREYHAAGAAGLFLEDQVWPKRCGHMEGKRVIPAAEWLAKLRAVADLRDEGVDLFLTARTDALAAAGLDEALARAKAAAALGVDAVFVEAPRSRDDLLRIADATPGMIRVANMVEGGRTPLLTQEDLADAGFTLVVTPLTGLFAATSAMRAAYAALRRDGLPPPPGIGFEEFNALVGLEAHRARGARYAADDEG